MNPVQEPQLERQGRRLTGAGVRWLLAGAIPFVPGAVLLIVGVFAGPTWMWVLGLAGVVIGLFPLTVAFSLLSSGAVSRWAARRNLFA
jgi:hypothetical protein